MERIKKNVSYVWLVAILLTVIGAALRFYDLGGPSLWIDEVFTELYTNSPVHDTLIYIRDDASLTPFYFLALHPYPSGSDFWLRSFSALMGTLAIPLLIILVERLYGDRWLALWAGALLTVNPFHVWLSRTARMYSLTCVLVLIVSYCFLLIVRRKDTRAVRITFTVASGIAYITHYFAAALPLAQYMVFGAQIRRRRRVPLGKWFVAQTIAVVPLLIWFGYLLKAETISIPIAWIPKPLPKDVALTLFDMTVGSGQAVSWALPGLIAALVGLGAGVVYAVRLCRKEPDRWYWLWLMTGTLGLTYLVSYLFTPMYVDRYFVVFLPGLILLILQGWQMLLKNRPRVLLTGVVALIGLTGAVHTGAGLYDKDYYKEDWGGVAAYVEQHSLPGDGLIFGHPVEMLAFKRYAVPDQVSFTWLAEPDRAILTPFDAPVSRVWLVVRLSHCEIHQTQTRFSYAKAGMPVGDDQMPPWLLARKDRIVEVKTFDGLALFRIDDVKDKD